MKYNVRLKLGTSKARDTLLSPVNPFIAASKI